MKEVVRIFISSPSDVGVERRRAALVVKRVQREFQRFWDVEPVLWESEAMLASGHFQDILIPPAQTQLFVAIVATRLGTPLPAERYRGRDGRVPVTGTEWEFENALEAAEGPAGEPELLVYKRRRREIRAGDPTEAAAAIAQWQALEGFWARYFGAAEPGFRRAFQTFDDADEFEALLEDHVRQRLRRRLERERRQDGELSVLWHQGSPYRGLERFEFEHAEIFHGRTGAQRQVIEQLVRQASRGTAFVLVAGTSGVGKSSLVRAGVMPDLIAPGVVAGVDTWRRGILRPRDGAQDLVQALATALLAPEALPELTQTATTAATLARQWRGDPAHAGLPLRAGLQVVAQATATRLGKPAAHVRVVLLVDQLEELFSLDTITIAERQAFAAVVAGLARDDAVWVMGAIRSDFYHRVADVPALLELTRGEGLFHLAPPTLGELRTLIEEPAAAAGVAFERNDAGRALSDEMLAAAADQPGGLPLLEFALNELYEHDVTVGGGRLLTFAGYAAIGQLEGAIAARADDARVALAARGPVYVAALDALLLGLVTVREDDDVVTGRTLVVDTPLAPSAPPDPTAAVVDELVGRRLLVASGADGRVRVELAHEALLAHWPYLQALVARERGFLRTRGRVTRDAKDWLAAGQPHDRSDLWLRVGKPLADAEDLLAHRRAELRGELQGQLIAFIEASQTQARHQRLAAQQAAERRARRARAVAGAFAVFTLVALAIAALAYRQWQTATTQAARALAGKLATTAQTEVLGQPELQLLLGAEALRLFDGPEPANALLSALLTTGALRATLVAPGSLPTSVAFTGDGQTLLSGGPDGLRLWDVTDRYTVGLLGGHATPEHVVWSVAISPDGHTVAAGREDGSIGLWDLATQTSRGELRHEHHGRMLDVMFSPDGHQLVSASFDGTVQLWDSGTREPLGPPLPIEETPVAHVSFSPDGRLLAVTHKAEVQLWDVAARAPLDERLRGHERDVTSVAFSPDGSLIASASEDKTVRLWDVATRRPVGDALHGHEGMVWALAFSADGRTLASASVDKTIRLWDVAAREPLGDPLRGHEDYITSLAFSPRGRLLASASTDRTIRLWDSMVPESLHQTIGVHADEVLSLAFSPDSRILASCGADQTVRLWDVAARHAMGDPLRGHEGPVDGVAFTPDGRILVSGGDDKTLRLFDVATGRPIGEPLRGHDDEVWSVAVDPSGNLLASGSKDKTIRLWDLKKGVAIGEPMRGHEAPVFSIAFSPDGKTLASSGQVDKTVRLWDVSTRQPIGEPLTGHAGDVFGIAFNPDGTVLASAGGDKIIRLWDVARRSPLGDPLRRGHRYEARTVAYSADGRALASGSRDHTIRLWDASTGQPFDATLTGHEGDVVTVAFSPDGRWLASGSMDKTVRLWDVDWQSWRRRACTLAARNLTCAEWYRYVADRPYEKTCDELPGPDPPCAGD